MRDTARGTWNLLEMSWRSDWRRTIIAVVLMAVRAVAAPLLAVLLGLMTNAVVSNRPDTAAYYGGLAGFVTILILSSGNFAAVAYSELAELAEMDFVQQLMLASNGSARMEHHDLPDYADMLTILKPDVKTFPNALLALYNLFGLILAAIFTAVLLSRLDPSLLLLLPLAAIPPLLAGRHAEKIVDRSKTRTATSTRIARNLFRLSTSARFGGELRVFRLGDELRHRHAELWKATSRVLWRSNARAAAVRAAGQVVFGLAYVGAVILVIRQAIAGHRSVGDVVLVIVLAAQVNQQVAAAVGFLTDLQRMASTLRRLGTVKELVASTESLPGNMAVPERLVRGIELEHVAFEYPGTGAQALTDISLTLPAGCTVAIVGENGAGKSTLVKLLCGLYRPSVGRILLDGNDLRGVPIDEWRTRIAAGFQDFVRYELVARTAVGVGDLPRVADDDAVLAALGRAHATDIVGKLDEGLDTLLGTSYDSGAELSGGQWQKLALGRAFMRETPLLLVLDEPTAALDPEAEHQLFEHYAAHARRTAQLTGGVTVIVSHRFSTVRMADLIVVIHDGHVEEFGDHDTLIRNEGLYAELFSLQAKAYR